MTGPALDALLKKAYSEEITKEEVKILANELTIYHTMALRMEKTIHDFIKDRE